MHRLLFVLSEDGVTVLNKKLALNLVLKKMVFKRCLDYGEVVTG